MYVEHLVQNKFDFICDLNTLRLMDIGATNRSVDLSDFPGPDRSKILKIDTKLSCMIVFIDGITFTVLLLPALFLYGINF